MICLFASLFNEKISNCRLLNNFCETNEKESVLR